MSTPLQDAIQAQNAGRARPEEVAEYRGSATAARFAGPQQEFSALLNGGGVYDLGFRASISITGGDRVRWLNGMVTNNIRDLAVGRGVYAFLLNPQGRILGDMHVYNRGESLLVETDRSQVAKIMATFDHFIIMDDVELANVSETQTALGIAGPRSRDLLNAVGIAVPEMQPLQVITAQCTCDCKCLECTVIRGEDASRESYEIWLAPKDVYKTWQALIAAGATPVGSEALEMQRIAAGLPLYGADIRERDLPQETEQERALNFNKGCYVGQEIVERIRSRGNVHRKFAGFLVEGTANIPAGAKIVSAEKEVGEVTSIAVVNTGSGEQTVLLGYIRREVGMPGRQVTIGAANATVIQLPLEMGTLRQNDDALAQLRS
ncbi:MAG TPA: folate-binding protein [Candidatus Sulfotelmatobacter sp.]|jgi:aminomethyltransferase|nr:folate-binding protein [Candidatus Sulfotelmatobacter sp.]